MRGGWSGFGMETVGIHPNDFDLDPNKIPTGGVVQNCRQVIIVSLHPPLRHHYCIQLKNIQHFFEKKVKETEPSVKFRVSHNLPRDPDVLSQKLAPCWELCQNHSKMVSFLSGDPLYVGFDLTIASFDSISEVSMVSFSSTNFVFLSRDSIAKS